MISGQSGRTAYIDADLREPGKILTEPVLLNTLDLDQPVGLLMIAVLIYWSGVAQSLTPTSHRAIVQISAVQIRSPSFVLKVRSSEKRWTCTLRSRPCPCTSR